MTSILFPPSAPVLVPLRDGAGFYPVSRIFCVGRNYADHAKEMGAEVDREAPFYFTKSSAHLVLSGATVPYPPGTRDFHHEMEFVVALVPRDSVCPRRRRWASSSATRPGST